MNAALRDAGAVDEGLSAAPAVVGSGPEWRMKTSIEHLPEGKQTQLQAIAALFRECPAVDKLILFGSFARGNWVEDEETGYVSDFDLCAVVDNEKQAADLLMWGELERRAREIAGRTSVTLIVHDIKFINREIRIGQYFWSDVANEGVLLVDNRRYTLAKPKALNAAERLELAEYNYRSWFESATEFWRGCRYYGARNLLKHAAFLLHQATERYYHAAHLVFTGYKQQTHDIEKLGTMAGEQHPLLVDALPKTEPEDKRLFELLKKAYIEARYSGSYKITPEELLTLQGRVVELAERVRGACIEKIATFCGPEAVQADLPVPPQMAEPLLATLPPPPEDPKDFAQWASNLAELSEQRGRAEGETVGEQRGEARGRQLGREEGRAEGEQRGRADGERRGKAEAVLLVLQARGLEVPLELERRILDCDDPAVLAAWLQRAVTATSAAEALAG
ncbi:MAG: HEPN domain-containing protein [Polyangia bacterium]